MRFSIATLIVISTLACQWSEDRSLDRRVTSEELHGTWTMTPEGVEGLRYAGYTSHLFPLEHVLMIRPDGSCSYRGFTGGPRTSGHDETFGETECRWRFGEVGQQALILELPGQPADALGDYFHFDEDEGRLLLWQYAGDPDAWKYVEFEKTGEGVGPG